jgi:hypothetical protein
MKNTLARLFYLLLLWFSVLDLFVGRFKGQWIWTIGVICVFLAAEGVARVVLWSYLKYGNRELAPADKRPNSSLGL